MPKLTPADPTPIPPSFSRDDQAVFLDTLAQWGNVTAAARVARVSRSTAYRMRRSCPRFKKMWDAALLLARPQVEAVLADRALNGTEESVYYHGEEVATRVRYDARLLLAHLARLDRLEDTRTIRQTAEGFDWELAKLLDAKEVAMVECVPCEEKAAPEEGQGGFSAQDTVSAVSSVPQPR